MRPSGRMYGHGCTGRRSSRRSAGVTLLELIVVMGMMVALTAGIGYGFVAGLDMQRTHAQRRAERNSTEAMEQRITRLLQGARLTDDPEDAATFFVGAAAEYGDTGSLGCDQLTFTTVAPGVPAASLLSEDDFETQHRARGPVGGVAEVSLSTRPVGNAGERTGLFERLQRPADGDPTQGGLESALAPQVDRIGFQFWDGQQWVDTWDTRSGERRLPAAVRVSYILTDTTGEDVRFFIVFIPASDVDAQNPVEAGGS